MAEKKKCAWCGLIKEVYAYREEDYEAVEDLPKEDLLIEDPSKPLRDDDIVGLPQCKQCYYESRGEELPTEEEA